MSDDIVSCHKCGKPVQTKNPMPTEICGFPVKLVCSECMPPHATEYIMGYPLVEDMPQDEPFYPNEFDSPTD